MTAVTALSHRVVACVGSIFVATAAAGQTFSVGPGPGGPGTPSPSGLPPDALFTFGSTVIAPGVGPVLPGSLFVNVDAISFGYFGDPNDFLGALLGLEFSVTPVSAGMPGTAVDAEATGGLGGPGDQAADIYFSPGGGGNGLVFDGDGIPNPTPAFPIGLIEPFGAPGDDVDAYDRRTGVAEAPVFFSVDPLSLGPPPGFIDPADIYVAPFVAGFDTIPPAGLYAPGVGAFGVGGTLQLVSGDNVDAVVVLDDGDLLFLDPMGAGPPDLILFSLSPGAPSFITVGSPYFGATPGDVLFVSSAGAAGVFAPAGSLGLSSTDDVNALDIVIPEPATVTMAVLGFLIVACRLRIREA